MDLMQYLQDYGAGEDEESAYDWLGMQAPIMRAADAGTFGLASRGAAGGAALLEGLMGQEGDFSSRYNENMNELARRDQNWEQQHPSLATASTIANLPLRVKSALSVPGMKDAGIVQGLLSSVGLDYAIDSMSGDGLDKRRESLPVAPRGDIRQLIKNTEPAGPNQNSPAGEVANFRVGNGEWQNGLDSRIGKNFSKGAPGSASAASERYQGVLEPGREDQVRQLYANTYEKIINGYSKSIASITDPKSREAAMKQIGNLAHETAMRVIPPEYQAQFGMGEETPQGEKAGADSEDPSTDGEGIGTLSGLALLLGGGAAVGGAITLAKKLGIPVPTAKAILQKFTGKGATSATETVAKLGSKARPLKATASLKTLKEKIAASQTAAPASATSSASPASAKLYKKISELSDVNNKKKEAQALTQLFRKGQLPPAVQEAKKGAKRHSYTPAVKRHSYVPKGK